MMTETKGTDELVKQLADEIISRLDKSYDLVYVVDYRDQLSDSQASALVRGDEFLEESWEWESDQRYDSAKEIIGELAKEVIAEWSEETDADLEFVADALEYSADEFDRVRFEIEERDTGGWVDDLIRNTPSVLLRIEALDEDHSYSFEEVSPRRVLKDLGFRATRSNVETVSYVLANASPEYSVLMGYWIVGADLADVYKLGFDKDQDVEIANPYLYLGNPFSGSGFISEQPLEGTVKVKREDLRTDKDAFGYGVDEIYGGLNASSFEAEIRPA